jgi:hypothetical protein
LYSELGWLSLSITSRILSREKVVGATFQKVIISLPDTVKILPGHFSVTDDGEYVDVTPGMPMVTTVGSVRQTNEIVQLEEEAFVEHMFENLPSKPPNYETAIATNQGSYVPESVDEENGLELGPNRCAATEDSVVADD